MSAQVSIGKFLQEAIDVHGTSIIVAKLFRCSLILILLLFILQPDVWFLISLQLICEQLQGRSQIGNIRVGNILGPVFLQPVSAFVTFQLHKLARYYINHLATVDMEILNFQTYNCSKPSTIGI